MSLYEDYKNDYAYEIYHNSNPDSFVPMQYLVNELIRKLKSAGISILRYDAYSTNSIYLKLDFGVCNSIRISDHKGKKHLKYRYNLIQGLDQSYKDMDKFIRYYYADKDLFYMIDRIISDRDSKLAKYGYKNYVKYMEENKRNHKDDKNGFWSQARLI